MTLTASGSINGTSEPGATTTSPSGLPSSVASLAMNLELPMPTEAVSPPVAVATAALRSATSSRSPGSVSSIGRLAWARSTNASSSDSGSTAADSSRRIPITWRLAAR